MCWLRKWRPPEIEPLAPVRVLTPEEVAAVAGQYQPPEAGKKVVKPYYHGNIAPGRGLRGIKRFIR